MHEAETPATSSSPRAVRIPIEGLEPIEVEAALDGETVLVDLRSEDDRATEGVPGAIGAAAKELISWAEGTWADMPFELERSRRIIVYSSEDAESRDAAEALREMGFERVAYLIGGSERWARHQTRATASSDATET